MTDKLNDKCGSSSEEARLEDAWSRKVVVLKDLGSFAEIAAALRGLEDSGGFGCIDSSDTVFSQSKQERIFTKMLRKL